MKKVLLSLVALMLTFNTVNAEVLENNKVAKINDTMYDTLDEAVKNATNSDTIELLSDATLTVGSIDSDKIVTIKGNNFIISVPSQPGENGDLALYGTLNIYNATINFGNEKYWSITMRSNSSLNLYNSECTVKYHGIYSNNNSTVNLDNSKMTLSNMDYTAMMTEGRSTINVKNKSELVIKDFVFTDNTEANGTTAYNINVDDSKILFDGCEKQGMVKGSLILTNGATAEFINCGVGINLYSRNEIIVNDGTELTVSNSIERAIMSQGNYYSALIVKKGGKLNITNNGTRWKKSDDESKYYADKGAITMGIYGYDEGDDMIYIYRTKSIINFEDGALVNITNNNSRGITFSGESAYIGNTTVITNNGGENVAVGGGIYNIYGNITISADAKIYNNHANTSSDDIYNSGENATIKLVNTGSDWTLDDCDNLIDGWYDDNKESRWNAHDKGNEYVEEVSSDKYENELTIKAAHGIYGKLIVKYVDIDGNELADEIVSSKKVGTEYNTSKIDIDGYRLKEVIGEEDGTYTADDITVIYVYEPMGIGGNEDIPDTGIYSNNILEISIIFSAIALIGATILKKKLAK